MNKQLMIGYITEGTSDVRFLESIIQRTFENLAFECESQIEVFPIVYLDKINGSFNEVVIHQAAKARDLGLMILCIHVDSDDISNDNVLKYKITPAFAAVEKYNGEICNNLVSIIPIHMTESWMLADKDLIKEELGTSKSDNELGLNRNPETIPNPKEVIKSAINASFLNLTKRRRYKVGIEDLYQPIGQKISLNKLQNLGSYKNFEIKAREALIKLNYLK